MSESSIHSDRFREDPEAALGAAESMPEGLIRIDGCDREVYLANGQSAVAEILKLNQECLAKGSVPACTRHLIGDGTSTSSSPPDGAPYYTPFRSLHGLREARRIALSPCFKASRLAQDAKRVRRIVGQWDYSSFEGDVDVYGGLVPLFASIGLQCVLNRRLSGQAIRLARLVGRTAPAIIDAIRHGNGFTERGGGGEARQGLSEILDRRASLTAEVAKELVEQSPLDPEVPDLLQTLADAGLTECQLRSTASGLLLAAFENTCSVASWALYHAANDELSFELRAGFVDDTMIDRIIAETLRLNPPVWSIGRQVLCPIEVAGQFIPAGSLMIASPWLEQRRLANWEQPLRFQINRFCSPTFVDCGRYFPFGLGRKKCPGKAFALLELRIVLKSLLGRFQFRRTGVAPEPLLGSTQRPFPSVLLNARSH